MMKMINNYCALSKKNFILLFSFFLFFIFHTQYSYALSTNTKLLKACSKTNELTKRSLACFNNEEPLQSVGFYFGCSRMLQYSIITKKDGYIKVSKKKLKYDIDKIYFRPKFNDDKFHIDRKTLQLKNPQKKVIGQCKIVDSNEILNKELKAILKSNIYFNKI